MDIPSYFRSASKSSVGSSSSDSEDGNESEIGVQSNPPKKLLPYLVTKQEFKESLKSSNLSIVCPLLLSCPSTAFCASC